ncbi:MAG: 2Fe-2S iron-sulfur cluster-binding protein [Steroidobacter sp.]
MLTFNPLKVSELRPEASDALCIGFEVPEHLRQAYRFLPGQHVGVRATIDGREVRRTYSICSRADDRHLHIGVRLHDRGSMSQHLASQVRVGDMIEVLTPTGRFFAEPEPGAARTYCAFASGSGITPILGILRNVLVQEPLSRFFLFYGNRTTATIMFAEELLALKDRYPERLSLYFILSREPQDVDLFNGRLDDAKVALLARDVFKSHDIDAFFLCGPGTMIDGVRDSLLKIGVDAARIHSERFATDTLRTDQSLAQTEPDARPAAAKGSTQVAVVMDGRRRSFSMAQGAATVLEAAENAGLELPYSCRAGVCSTCRTRVTRGAVTMTTNYALEPWEVEAGFVLACQSLPTTPELELNYDER